MFGEINEKKIICSCHPDNIPSKKLQQSCGMTFTHSEEFTRKKDNVNYMTEYYNPNVEQAFSDTCAIKSQQLILEDFGINVTEADLVRTAAEHGWYNGGTLPQDVGKLLELADIPVTRQEGANVCNLVNELA